MRRRSAAIGWIAFAILVLGGLYWGLQASLGGREAGVAQSRTYRVSISTPRAGDALPIFRATQGDTVTLVISSDRPGETHVHGYEEKMALRPGGQVTLTFTAAAAGRFPLHLHAPDSSMHHLATLEVQPQ